MKNHEFLLTLPDFNGPIELLLSLIQEKEIHAENVSLISILEQYIDLSSEDIDMGAEFISSASTLLFLKSRALLPEDPLPEDEDKGSSLNKQEAIMALIEYVKFKKAGEDLCVKDKELSNLFTRGLVGSTEWTKPLGVEHLSLDDLGLLFKGLMEKRAGDTQTIYEEVWRVSDKITFIKRELTLSKTLSFFSLFLVNQSKQEWIVTFLAILELMKLGIIQAKKEGSEIYIAAEKAL